MPPEEGTLPVEEYLSRIGLSPADLAGRDVETLARLQRAHVTAVPFETLSITGDPHGPGEGEGVSLALPDLYGKVVERRRGGYCYELNGLFGWLLGELGFDPRRVAAMVVTDGDPRPPANHLTHVVDLDRRYLVDVGMGSNAMRRPVPLDGETVVDGAGVEWRVVPSDRPDVEYATEARYPGDEDRTTRYVFEDVPREMAYFEATCDFLASAPESPFTGDPVVSIATEDGYLKLSPDALRRVRNGEERVRAVDPDEYHELLDREFGLAYGRTEG